MRAQCTTYRDGLNAVLAEVQLNGKCQGWFHIGVFKIEHSLHIGDADIKEKSGDRTPLYSADDDDVEAVFLLAGPS